MNLIIDFLFVIMIERALIKMLYVSDVSLNPISLFFLKNKKINRVSYVDKSEQVNSLFIFLVIN